MVEINSETDFVAKNEDFIDFANRVAEAAAAAWANSAEELAAADRRRQDRRGCHRGALRQDR